MKTLVTLFLTVAISSSALSQTKIIFPTYAYEGSTTTVWDMCDYSTSPCTYLGKVSTFALGTNMQFKNSNPISRRFHIKQNWERTLPNGKKENGTDVMIVDFEKNLTSEKALSYIKELTRTPLSDGTVRRVTSIDINQVKP